MQKVSIARLRRAADVLRSRSKIVNIHALAVECEVKHWVVGAYVQGVDGLKEELGIGHTKNLRADYPSAIQRLIENGNVITLRRIACLTRVRENNAKMWWLRHSDRYPSVRLVTSLELRWRMMAARIAWIKRCNQGTRLNKCVLADMLGRQRASLHRTMRRSPELRDAYENIKKKEGAP